MLGNAWEWVQECTRINDNTDGRRSSDLAQLTVVPAGADGYGAATLETPCGLWLRRVAGESAMTPAQEAKAEVYKELGYRTAGRSVKT
jgi:hypothetical protein